MTSLVPLRDLIDIFSGYAFKSDLFSNEGELPLIRIRDVKRGYSETFYSGEYEERYIVSDGDLLVGMDGEFNRERWAGGRALLNQRVCKITCDSSKLDATYFYHYLPQALKSIEDKTPFATVKHLSAKDIKESFIPLPPLPEQRRIAAIMDKADALRRKRKRAIELLDSLTQSIFLEMFGDPAANPNGYVLKTPREIAEKISDGPFGSNLKSEHYVENGVRVIRLQNIGAGRYNDADRAFISDKHFETISKHECLPGDVLIGTLGDPNLRACIQPEEIVRAVNKADCVQLRVDQQKASPEYVVALLNQPSVEKLAQSLMLGQTRTRISMGRLRDLALPFAPIAEQFQFSARVKRIVSLRQQAWLSVEKINTLFDALQHRAFSGQL